MRSGASLPERGGGLPFHELCKRAHPTGRQLGRLLLEVDDGALEGGELVVELFVDEDEYALDFAHPLSPVHAFALFLCTSAW